MKSFKLFLEHPNCGTPNCCNECSTEVTEGNGLWTNIHAKRKRGETPAKPGDKGYPSKEAIRSAQEEVEQIDEVSTEKLRDYASAALQDKNKAKADKRWKYAGKAMDKVADREVKAAHALKYNKTEEVDLDEAESWEAGYKRRVVKTTSAEHKEKGYNWRIKGKERPEISIKLYKEKPSQQEFNKQMRRVAGHEFGG